MSHTPNRAALVLIFAALWSAFCLGALVGALR